jgi:hypothetical protein
VTASLTPDILKFGEEFFHSAKFSLVDILPDLKAGVSWRVMKNEKLGTGSTELSLFLTPE